MNQFNQESNDDISRRVAQMDEIIEHLKKWIGSDPGIPQVLINGAVNLVEKTEMEKQKLMDK